MTRMKAHRTRPAASVIADSPLTTSSNSSPLHRLPMQPDSLQNLRRRIASRPFRTTAIPVAMALLMVLAGCASVAAELPFTAPEPYTETGAELHGTDLRADHLAELDDAESFSSRSSLVLDGEEQTFAVNRSAAVDGASNQSMSTTRYNSDAVEGDGLVVTSYTNGSVTYRQVEIDAGQQTITRYDAASEPYDAGLLGVEPVNSSRAAHADLVATVADDVNWTMVGVERDEGDWVTRYEASGPENFSAIGSTAVAEGGSTAIDRTTLPETLDLDIRSINATLLVSPAGVVRLFEVHATGNAAGHPVELTLTLTADGLGSSNVEAPSWIDEARTKASA